MRRILTSLMFVASVYSFAQVGVNVDETTIAGDAVFHVMNKTGESKGIILPTVSLKSSGDQTTVTGANNHVTTGLMVWNDGNGGLSPAGYYYWDGVKWVLTGNVDNASTGSDSTIAKLTHFSNAHYTLKSTDTVVVCDEGSSLQVIIPDDQFVEGRHFVLLNRNCSGGLIINDSKGNNVLSGNSSNTDLQEGIGQNLYYDGNKWMNTTGY